jgi:hypothetical protein
MLLLFTRAVAIRDARISKMKPESIRAPHDDNWLKVLTMTPLATRRGATRHSPGQHSSTRRIAGWT